MVPIDEEVLGSNPLPRVAPSAPLELIWVGHQLLTAHDRGPVGDGAVRQSDQLAGQLRDFWGDGVSGGSGELVILADLAGVLFETDMEVVFDALKPMPVDPDALRLSVETPEDQRRFRERVPRLAGDPSLLRRYVEILRRIWAPYRSEWEAEGLPQLRRTCRAVEERLERGASLDEAAPVAGHLAAKHPAWRRFVADQARTGRLVVCPGYFGGSWSVWDLPNHAVLGFKEAFDPVDEAREDGRELAPRFRALGDPTRLALYLELAARPSSVGELAARFGLAQPTVSAHLKVLRGAALVVGRREGGRTSYSTEREQLAGLLQEMARCSGVELSS